MKKIRVYIAGLFTKGGIGLNMSRAMDLWHDLRDAGFSPYCPHLTHFLDIHRPRSYEEWLEFDLEWLDLCDAFIRLPGDSDGSDKEAHDLNIPVFTSINSLVTHFGGNND